MIAHILFQDRKVFRTCFEAFDPFNDAAHKDREFLIVSVEAHCNSARLCINITREPCDGRIVDIFVQIATDKVDKEPKVCNVSIER